MAKTKAQITQRISEFENAVNKHAAKIIQAANEAWNPIKEKSETSAVRAFLTKHGAGIDHLNSSLAALLSKNGRVVKFAGLFLHGTPMVRGWLAHKSQAPKSILAPVNWPI